MTLIENLVSIIYNPTKEKRNIITETKSMYQKRVELAQTNNQWLEPSTLHESGIEFLQRYNRAKKENIFINPQKLFESDNKYNQRIEEIRKENALKREYLKILSN
jgi:hypothetical protein